jgi:long-chain acyl-CoA synthetase
MDYWTVSSIPQLFFDVAARLPDHPCFLAKTKDGWHGPNYGETAGQIRQLARGLRALGLEAGDRVALIAENRPEWGVADFAIMAAGCISTPAYTTNTVADHRHILANSGAKAAIVSTRALADKVLAAAKQTEACRLVISIEPTKEEPGPVRVIAWSDAMAAGANAMPDIDAIVAGLARTDVAAIIHTSGTGGTPRGVTLTHGNILANVAGAVEVIRPLGLDGHVWLSFLPMSHSYEHTAGLILATGVGSTVCFAENLEKLTSNMAEVKPSLMTAVPRLYEIMHQRILAGVEREGRLKAKLFHKTVELGTKRYRGRLSAIDRLADAALDRLVRAKVRQRFGGRLIAFVSGGAALNPDIGVFFTAIGVQILQGYGQTETAPVVAVNLPGRAKMDTVGPPMQGVEVKIAGDGEILVRGECVMPGYWNDPNATAATIRDGWLHTGDVGEFDSDGYLKITDRKKDFLKNTGGDMIAPAKVEGTLMLEPEIGQAMLYGDGKPWLSAVIVPRQETIDAFAKASGASSDLKELAENRPFRALIDAAVDRANKKLQPAERVRRYVLAREPFSLANEQMTATLKVRRHKVREAYGADLETLYR